LIVPYLAPRLIPTFIQANKESGNVFLWTILQATSWTSVAVLELIIYRENILSKYIKLLIGILILMIFIFFTYNRFLNLTAIDILKINVLAVIAVGFGQLAILKKKAFYYKFTFLTHSFLALVTVVCLCLN